MENSIKEIDILQDIKWANQKIEERDLWTYIEDNSQERKEFLKNLKEFEKVAKNFTPKEKVLYMFFCREHSYRFYDHHGGQGNVDNLNQFWAWDDYIGETDKDGFLLNENGLYQDFPELVRVQEDAFMTFFTTYGAMIFNLCELRRSQYSWNKLMSDLKFWKLEQDDTGFNIRRDGWDEWTQKGKDACHVFDYQNHFRKDFKDYSLEEWNSHKQDYEFIETESQLEDLFVKRCEERGFRCTKNNAKTCKGIPDRLVTGQYGTRCYIELKKPFDEWTLSKSQLRCISDLRESGAFVEILDDPYKIDDLLDYIEENCEGTSYYRWSEY